MQAYVGDRLGYDEDPITRNMTIAVTDAGAVDGADIISQVSLPSLCLPLHYAKACALL